LELFKKLTTKKGLIMEKHLKDLLIDELGDLLSAEKQIVAALPKVIQAVQSPELKEALQSHLKETREQVQRIGKVFKLLKIKQKTKFCKGMRGLIQECSEVTQDFKTKSSIRDAALISKAQRIEHYEISAYGTVRTFAKELGLDEAVDLLQKTLDEEAAADKKLSKLAEGGLLRTGINEKANAKVKAKAEAIPAAKKKTTSKKKSVVQKKSMVAKKTAARKKLKKPARSAAKSHARR
jgi:ferritin-like metal-binding protein YciE